MIERRACVRCGRPADVLLVGRAAPVLCPACSHLAQAEQQERTLAGSPYETALKQEVNLDENWWP